MVRFPKPRACFGRSFRPIVCRDQSRCPPTDGLKGKNIFIFCNKIFRFFCTQISFFLSVINSTVRILSLVLSPETFRIINSRVRAAFGRRGTGSVVQDRPRFFLIYRVRYVIMPTIISYIIICSDNRALRIFLFILIARIRNRPDHSNVKILIGSILKNVLFVDYFHVVPRKNHFKLSLIRKLICRGLKVETPKTHVLDTNAMYVQNVLYPSII